MFYEFSPYNLGDKVSVQKILPCNYLLEHCPPISNEIFKQILFSKGKRNTYIAYEKNGLPLCLLIFHWFSEASNSANVSLLIFDGADIQDEYFQFKFAEKIESEMEKEGLFSLSSVVVDMEEQAMLVLKKAGFTQEAHAKETIYHKGKYHDQTIMTKYRSKADV